MKSNKKEFTLLHSDSSEIFRRMFENLRVGVYVSDAEGNLIHVNQVFVGILGYSTAAEIVGRNLAAELYVKPEDRKTFLKAMEKTGFVCDYEVENIKKDGSTAILSVTSNYVRDEHNQIMGVEGIVRDITYQKAVNERFEMLDSALDYTDDSIIMTNFEGNIKYVNPSFEKLTEYSLADVIGLTPQILKSGVHDQKFYENLWKKIKNGKVFRAQITNKKKFGDLFIVDQTITPVKDKTGLFIGYVSVWKDVTEQINVSNRLKFEKMKLEEIVGFDEKISRIRNLDKLLDFVVKKVAEILKAKKCSIMLLDDENNQLCIRSSVGMDHTSIIASKVKVGDEFAGGVIKSGGAILVDEVKTKKMKNELLAHSYLGHTFIIVPIILGDKAIGLINIANKGCLSGEKECFDEVDLKISKAIAREVAVAIENVQLYRELNYLVVTDPLTQIYNFRQFNKSLEHEVNRANRFKRPLCLLMIDIDDLKQYNDTFGHLEGDNFLKKISRLFVESLRDIDIVCRYAGDEFVGILPETDVEQAKIVADKLIKKIEETKFKKNMTISIGVAQNKEKEIPKELVKKADVALYEAKKNGKNQSCAYS